MKIFNWLNIHPHFVNFWPSRNKQSRRSLFVFNDGIAIRLLGTKQVPEGAFLFNSVVSVIVMFGLGSNTFEEADGLREILGLVVELDQLVVESVPQFEMKVFWDMGSVHRI